MSNVHYYSKYIAYLLRAVLLVIVLSSSLYSQYTTLTPNSINQIVQDELAGLNRFYHRQFEVQETTGEIQAKQPRQIMINTNTLASYISSLDEPARRIIVRLVIAHEFIHLLQMERPEIQDYLATRYQRKILEAQADILAARYTVSKAYEDSASSTFKGLNMEDKRFVTAYRFFFDIGTATFSISDHPSQFQRATSIYRGIRYANIELLEAKQKKINAQGTAAKRSISNKLKGQIRIEKVRLNALNYNDVFDWSLNQAELICHGSPVHMSNLIRGRIVQKVKTIDGEKYLVGSYALINEGDIPLHFQYEGRIGRDRTDSKADFFDKIDFYEGAFHDVIIQPHRSIVVDAIIPLPPGSTGKEFVLAPDSNSLYSVKAASDSALTSTFIKRALSFSSEVAELNLKTYLETLNSAIAEENMSYIVSSIGAPSNKMYPLYKNYFSVATPTGQGMVCKVGYDRRVDPKEYMVELTLGNRWDSLSSIRVFDSFETRLKDLFQFDRKIQKNVGWYTYYKSQRHPNNLICLQRELYLEDFYDVTPDIRINARPRPNDSRKSFKVYLTIRKKTSESDNEAIEEVTDMNWSPDQ
jgi:Zn-dependent peptidase ImmA (M78 family)